MRPEKLCLGAKRFHIVALAVTLVCATSAWAAREKILHNFVNLPHGADPQANLIGDASGNLYGTAYNGGEHGLGAVFKLSQEADGKWTQSVLYSFLGTPDGANPTGGLIFDSTGNLYGTTTKGGYSNSTFCFSGCGVVFKLAPSADGKWSQTILHRFRDTDGSTPYAAMVFDPEGNLYGTTGAVRGRGQFSSWPLPQVAAGRRVFSMPFQAALMARYRVRR